MGGLYAARTLARHPVRVTVVDRHNYHLFQPLLYQVATAALSPGEIAQPIRSVLRRYPNVEVLLGEVTAIDLAGRRVLLGDERRPLRLPDPGPRVVPLLLREGRVGPPGARAEVGRRRPGDQAPHPPGLRAGGAGEGPAARQALLTFVVVGGGPTGVELAGAMAEIARQTLKHDFRSIDPAQSRDHPPGSGPHGCSPPSPRSSPPAPSSSWSGWAWRYAPGPWSPASRPTEVRIGTGRGGHRDAHRAVGRRGAGLAAAAHPGAPAGPQRAGGGGAGPDPPGHPEVYVIGDAALYTPPGGQAPPGRGPGGDPGGRPAAENIWRTISGRPPAPLPLPQPGQHGHHRAPGRRGRPGLAALQRVPGLGAVAGGAHLLADRVRQPGAGLYPLGLVLLHLPAGGPPDHRAGRGVPCPGPESE